MDGNWVDGWVGGWMDGKACFLGASRWSRESTQEFPDQLSNVELCLVGLLQPSYKLNYNADGNRLPEPVGCRCQLDA